MNSHIHIAGNVVVAASMAMQSKADAERKWNTIDHYCEELWMQLLLLGRQGLSFRGSRETLVDDSLNTGNFLEALKLLSCMT